MLDSAPRRTAGRSLPPVADSKAPRVHFLHPGDVVLAMADERLETLLGSCVSIILADPRRTMATMCHIVHSGLRGSGTASGSHAEGAWKQMERLLLGKGLTPRMCDAFVYGGGNMFPDLVRESHVGDVNSNRALDILERQGVRVAIHDLGGAAYRRLSWTVGAGVPTVTSFAV